MAEHTTYSEYQKGFNEAYILMQHMPELTDKIAAALPASDRADGFKHGKEEYEVEKIKERMPYLNKDHNIDDDKNISPQREKGMDMDRD